MEYFSYNLILNETNTKQNLPVFLAWGLELVFGPLNPMIGERIFWKVDGSDFDGSSLFTWLFSVSFSFKVEEGKSTTSTFRSVSWWLWLSHLKLTNRMGLGSY